MSARSVSYPVNWVLGCQTLKHDSLNLSCFSREIINQLVSLCLYLCRVVRETDSSKRKSQFPPQMFCTYETYELNISLYCRGSLSHLSLRSSLFALENKAPAAHPSKQDYTGWGALQFEEMGRFPMDSSILCPLEHHSEKRGMPFPQFSYPQAAVVSTSNTPIEKRHRWCSKNHRLWISVRRSTPSSLCITLFSFTMSYSKKEK